MYLKYIQYDIAKPYMPNLFMPLSCFFTNALWSHFAVSIRALASERALCIDALLTGLAVMFIPLTLIHIYESIKKTQSNLCAGYVSHIWVYLFSFHICCCTGILLLQQKGHLLIYG